VRIAVLGLGSAGARHARLLGELGHEVVGWDPVAASDVGSASEAVLASDAVVVASPNSSHADQALLAIEHGRPVLVEKPLAATAAAAREVAAAAASSGVVCAVAMNLRFHPGVLELKRLADSGSLGRLLFARVSFGFDLRQWRPATDYRESYSARADLGGGIVLDAIHEIDYLLWLLGPAQSVSGEVVHVSDLEIDVEDMATATTRHASGAVGQVDLNFFEPSYRRGCVLVGSSAVAEWSWEGGVTLRDADGERQLVSGPADLMATYRAELEDFVAAARGERPPAVAAADGAAALAVAEAIKESSRAGCRVDLG
jgi:predicted dehydrogenase